MGKRHYFQSLGGKLMLALLVSGIVALGVMYGSRALMSAAIGQWYANPQASFARLEKKAAEFSRYVRENDVAVTDLPAIVQWSKANRYYQLIIYGESGALYEAELAIEHMTMEGDELAPQLFMVQFADGDYQVSLYDYSPEQLYLFENITSVLLAFVVILVGMLLYNRRLTGSILRLTRQVRQVSRGDLTLPIRSSTKDEIGQLGQDVETMRLSIMEQLGREETAWQANAQLLTALSHDVRTPLTSLMGYLDILAEDEELPPEKRKEYLEVCRQKTDKLRDLTNEMFGYFLVFGRPDPELHLEDYAAGTLLEQLLFEHVADLEQRGFTVQNREQVPEGAGIRVDVQHLRRVFDNLFSNVTKYAAPGSVVTLLEQAESETLRVTITNYIRQDTANVESNRIGLRTCSKLIDSMGGKFIHETVGAQFTAEVTLPLLPAGAVDKTVGAC